MLGGIAMTSTSSAFLKLEDLKVGMKTTADQLSHITNKYMMLVYDKMGDKEGTLVFIGDERTSEFDKWFYQSHQPINPIYHTDMEFDDSVVYDE